MRYHGAMAIIVELPPELGVEAAKRFALGGMAEVFTADRIFPQGGRTRLVVKQMLPQHLEHAELVGRFRDEARLGLRLRHSNIVRVLDYREIDGQHYMLMERIEGLDLATIIQSCRRRDIELPGPVAAFFLQGIASALAYMADITDDDGASLELIHRDISPSNILVSHDGVIKLIDFGVARARERETRTATGVFVGKYSYMSPEQIRNEPMDIRSDLFALGAVGYELLTGQRAFQGESDFETFNLILDGGFVPIEELRPGLDPLLAGPVTRCLSPRIEDRYHHPLGLVEDLAEYMHRAAERPPPLLAMEFVRHLSRRADADDIEEIEPDPTNTASNARITAKLGPTGEDAPSTATTADDPTVLVSTPTPLPPAASLLRVAPGAGAGSAMTAAAPSTPPPEPGDGEVSRPPPLARPRAPWLAMGVVAATIAVVLSAGGVVAVLSASRTTGPGGDGAPTADATSHAAAVAEGEGKRDTGGDGADGADGGDAHGDDAGTPDADGDAHGDDAGTPDADGEHGGGDSGSTTAGDVPAEPRRDDRGTGKPEMTPAPSPKPTADADDAPSRAEQLARLAAEQAEAEAARAETGTLTIFSHPWAMVTIDGKPAGRTPLKNHELSAGTHTLRLVNEEAGKDDTITVTITAGENTTIKR